MTSQTSSDNQVLHDELEKAKETLSRLRCINGLTSTCCTTSKKCQGCWRHAHDVTIGVCSDRDGKYSRACGSKNWKDEGGKKREVISSSRVDSSRSRVDPSWSRVDSSRSREDYNQSRVDSTRPRVEPSWSRVDSRGELQQLYRQIESLEDDIRGPILSYIKNMERQNVDMTDAIETIRRQFFAHERVCPAMHNSEKDDQDFRQKFYVSQKTEQECRTRAESLEKELVIYREKLERSEARVKDLYRKISEKQSNAASTSSEVLLENQLRHEQQLTETYFKEATSKDKELSFLTIEKYNLESEINSMVTDLESSNRKRDEVVQEKNRLETNLEECRQAISCLEQQLKECRTENKRLKTKFRGVLDEERTRDEKISENQTLHEKQIKELRKKCKKYEEHRNSQKDITQRLENDRSELLTKAKTLSNEYKMKILECENLREENQRLSKEISGVQVEASLSKTDYNNSRMYVESLKNELQQAKSSIKILEHSLQESKVNESKTMREVAVFSDKETALKDRIETAERERLLLEQEIKGTRKNEIALKNEITQMKDNAETSHKEVKELNQHCSGLKTDLELTREKYFQIKKANDELVLNKSDVERTQGFTNEELARLKANYEEIAEKNSKLCADVKAYKRIVVEKENQLKKVELELTQLHNAKDEELKEILKKDREIAFLKARVSSTERSRGAIPGQSNMASGQYESGHASKDIEIYLERIVELECECKAQKTQIDELQKNQFQAKKHAQRSDSLKQELESQDDEIQKLKREISRSKQVMEDLQDEKDKLGNVEEERDTLRQDVMRLQAKVEEVSELKQACEEKEEEMKALKRMSSEEVDLEGKVSRLKDRCREKDEEIEELHQKVISLQVKVKDFMQQSSQVEDQMRSMKDKYSMELSEKERISQALKNAETKCQTLQNDLEGVKNRSAVLEKNLLDVKRQVATMESENEGSCQKMADLLAENKTKEEEMEQLRKQIQEAANVEEEIVTANDDVPDGASTPLDNSLDGSRLSLGRSGRTSTAYDRLDVLEEENIHLLNKQGELEDELDAAEEHAQELKNALKAKRDNVNELHTEYDELKEKLKVAEKAKAEMADENEQLQQTCLLSKQKIEDLKAASERYMDESDELEKALTTSEKKIEDLEKRREEVSGKCASSEGQLQSVTERLARKEKELQVVETQVDEQRKLCDGYKTSAERQESLIEKLRTEKVTAEETFLAVKLEMAKKEGTYKAGKEKVAELQTRLYEIEDKLSGKTNEWKKVSRENERLKKEIKELEIKIMELQTTMKKRISSDVDRPSGVYNPKLLSLNTSVKGNSQNVEGLDTKLNSAQNKISTLEVELANDLRKFSLSRTGSDVSRRGYSSKENQLSPGSHSVGRPRSNSNLSVSSRPGSATGFGGEVGYEDKRPGSSATFDGEVGYEDKRSGSSASFTRDAEFIEKRTGSSTGLGGDIDFAEKRHTSSTSVTRETDYEEKRPEKSDFNIPQVEIDNVDDLSEDSFFEKLDDGNYEKEDMSGEKFSSKVESALFQADPFLSGGMNASLTRSDDFSPQNDESLIVESSEALTNRDSSLANSQALTQETEVTQETVTTSASTVVTGTSSSHSVEQWNGEEELIYF